MRVLIVDKNGDGMLDTVLRAQQCGHQIKWFIRTFDKAKRPVGQGLAERVPEWRSHMQWADLVIVADNSLYMSEFDAWRARGCNILGGNNRSAEWEIDRNVGMQVLKRAGIPVAPYREFNDYDSAIRYVEREGEVFYSKPCKAVDDKSLSAKTGVEEDPAYTLRRWKTKYRRPPCPFILQSQLKGIEYAVGVWFGPAGFADGWEENWETKRMFPGDLGENTGEMGTTLRYVKRSKLADKVLKPLEDQLDRIGFIGNCDVNCIVDEEGTAWPLEFTMRFGLPSWMIETALFDCDPIEFLYAVAAGESTVGAHRMNEIAVGVVIAIPPYPHAVPDYDKIIGVPLYGTEKAMEHFHPAELQAGETTDFMSAGDYLGVATGVGETVREAARGAYRVLDKLSVPASPFWRVDISQRLRKDLPRLQEHGFASGMEY
jgi:phosphoribosylamine---glycine ligase